MVARFLISWQSCPWPWKLMTSQRVGSAQAVMDGSGANGIIKKQKKCLLLIFSPNLAFNGLILVVLCSKVDFLNLFIPWKCYWKICFEDSWAIFSSLSGEKELELTTKPFASRTLHGLLIRRTQNISLQTLDMRRKQNFAVSPLLFFSFSCLIFSLLLGNVFRKAFRILGLDER